jgi:hypothetical protein
MPSSYRRFCGIHYDSIKKMTPEFFVESLEKHCRDSAVKDCIANFMEPPGRKPAELLVRLSNWFRALPPNDQEMVALAMKESADATLFGVLCVIDGGRVIEDGPEKSEFELAALRQGSRSVISPSTSYLHDLLIDEA